MGSLKAVYQWVLRTMMKSKGETGIVQTMPKKDLVELNTQVTAQRLMQNGIDPTTLKNADQVENVIRRLESRPTTEGVASTKTAKIMDMKGKEIDPKSKIMGGKQAETDAEIKARLDKGNKEGLARIKESQARERQRMIDRSIDNASPGFSGDRKVDAELVAELMADNMGKVYDDLPTKERLDLYAEAFDALSKKRFEDFAQGGRAGFDNGGAPSIKYDFDKKQGPMGPVFETNKVEEAIKEIIRRRIPVDFANIPITDRTGIMLGFDDIGVAGEKDLLGGELRFGGGKNFGTGEKKFGLEFRKKFKDGSGMTRRTFLKILGGAMAIPIVGKFLKPFKTAKGVTKVPMIKTDDVPGKPEWFDQLVNKVIMEGDDVTKRFATGERQSIHQKRLDDGSVVRVTEDVDDGAVRVEYESKTNPYEETTQLEYKKPKPDEGDPRPTAEFSAAETGPVARSDSARLDYEKDIEEFATGNVDELVTDFSKLKEYATGKKPTMSEIVEAKKKKDQAKKLTEGDFDAEFELMEKRQGQPFYDPPLPDDFASGGIARMLGE